MSDKICAKCGVGWVIQADDRHCGYCGCAVFDFAVRWEKEPLLYAGNTTNIHELTILVENTGAYPVRFEPIHTDGGSIIKFLRQNKDPFEVKAGEQEPIPIQLNAENLVEHTESIKVRAIDPPSDAEREKSLRLQVYPTPDFELTPSKVVIRHRKGEEKVTINLHLEVLRSQFRFKSIKCSPHWVKQIICPTGLYKKGNAAKKVSLDISCKDLKDDLNTATLEFELHGYSKNIQKQINIHREVQPDPPKLVVQPMQLQVTQNREIKHFFTLQNIGEETLEISEIEFNDPSGLVQLRDVKYPIEIPAEGHHNIDMLISPDGVNPETHHVKFTIHSNCGAFPQYQDTLIVNVIKQREYPHYLAIDFGTTNSCCAYIDLESNKPTLIPLDAKENPPEIMASLIVYHKELTNGKTHHVGYDAETYRTSVHDGAFYISSVKRWLGYEWRRYFPNNQELSPCDVVADILKHIITQAEDHLDKKGLPSKISSCAVSHPTMFLSKQREDLKLAFRKIGIKNTVFIDEASAASIGNIYQFLQKHETFPKDYSMLVYDFGGGTIDIVLSKINGDKYSCTIQPVARGGNPKFGGDDVTQAIVDYVLKHFSSKIKEKDPNLRFEIPYLRLRKILQPSGNPKLDNVSYDNSNILYSRAEEIKLELSDEDKDEDEVKEKEEEKEKDKNEASRNFQLEVVVGDNVSSLDSFIEGSANVSLSLAQFQSFIEPILKETFMSIDAMIAENNGTPPEIVVLAGQSSKMPMLKRLMADHLRNKYEKDIPIELAADPKECVVIGAAEYGLTKRVDGTDILIDLEDKTHSRFGIMSNVAGKRLFREIIPKGTPLPIPKNKCIEIDAKLSDRTVSISVYEHFGVDNDITNASLIGDYSRTLPDDISERALRQAKTKMLVDENHRIEVIIVVDGKEYETTFERIKPVYVDEI